MFFNILNNFSVILKKNNKTDKHSKMEDKSSNVINNYKGVMLCSRPNQVNAQPVEKPFCGRVFPHEQIGLVPASDNQRAQQTEEKSKPKLEILSRHKKWLKEFQSYKSQQKEDKEVKIKIEEEKFKKIKQMAVADRERARKMRNQYDQAATNVMNVLQENDPNQVSHGGELTKENLRRLDEINEKKNEEVFKKKKKKVEKPIWAQTQEEVQKKQEEEVDEVLNFFENGDINQFSEDEQVKQILKNLKSKISQLKQAEDWKDKEVKKMQLQKRKQQKTKLQDGEEDKYSRFSVQSESKSVASEKSQKKIDELRQKKAQQEQWDKHTASQKHSYANVDERIAKNLADEVLRNYPHLRGVHSNTSIRKLLEAEATRAINEPIPRPVITTVIKEKKPLDTNNLPYLHRNPAI